MSGLKLSRACCNFLTAQVPDAVLNTDFTSEKVPSAEAYYGVLLFLDISGFSMITEKYTAMHEQGHGADELTNGLNCYISKLVECILEEGGDILNYAGDAILAQWVIAGMQASDVISLAVKCALKIQSKCGVQEMKYDCKLRVKIALSTGKLSKIIVGEKSRRFFAVIGPAVDEVRLTEPLANPGDIILSPKTWNLCTQEKLVIQHIENNKAVKMLRFKKEPRFSVEMYRQMLNRDKKIPEKSYLRSAFQSMPDMEKEKFLRKYMMKTVLQDIDDNQPPDLSSEIRPVTIMFINMEYVSSYTPTELCDFVQEATVIISNKLCPNGQINKIFFFDKGCTFLCVFGLPGYKRKDESALALQAADSISKTCRKTMKHLKTISIGVTTGLVYCGVVGHQLRNEYTVMGNKVNLAARLMIYYPGIVSCDWETKNYSGLPCCCFKEEIEKDLKGVSDPGKIYYFKPRCHQRHVEASVALEMEKDNVVGDMHRTLTELNVLGAAEGMTVKHAAFLGHTFTTEMLLNILPQPLKEKHNDILMTLFKSGVFKCASKPTNVSPAKTEETKLICYCESNATDGLTSVAGVWKCQLMCFCKTIVMDMTYQQLLKEQKRQLHRICASYLEKEAYRCDKCATDTKNTLQKNVLHPIAGNGNDRENLLGKVDLIVKEEQTRTTAGCKCAQLLETVLIPIVRHWNGVGNMSRAFFYLVESATVCASLSDDLKAMHYLMEAKRILENLNDGNPTFESVDPESLKICKFDQAVMHRLTGEILFNAGNILEAEENFEKALKLLNCSLLSNGVAGSINLICEKIKEYCYPCRNFETPEKRKLEILHEQISCLSFLWQISYIRGQSKSASLAISMQGNLATRSSDIFEMLFSTTDYLQYSQFVSEDRVCRSLEAWLCRMCARLSDCTESRRLIGHVTRTLAMVQLRTGNLKQSNDFTIGAQQLGGLGFDARAIGVLHQALLFTGRYKESMQLICKLERISNEMSSSIAEGWFYAACLNLLLYAGFSLKPFDECLDFVKECQPDANLVTDKSLMMQLYSSLALWYARLNEWENFAVYYDKVFGLYSQLPASIHSISSVTVFLECSVLLAKKELATPGQKACKRTLKLFSDFRQRFRGDHIFAPRVLHLNAFLYQLLGKKTLAEDILMAALQLCEKQGNLLDHKQIKQSQATWFGACSQTPADCSADIMTMSCWHMEAIFKPEEFQYCFDSNVISEAHSESSSESNNGYISGEHPSQESITDHVHQDQPDQPEPQKIQDKMPAVEVVDMVFAWHCNPLFWLGMTLDGSFSQPELIYPVGGA
ncbi:adenylate cyclase type 10-like isoform X2 [Ictalurus furcatus]|uniref:adenylate cyclase type 10-like isoform X2 n=1 Tax=Ictalurus furcatus TaxID=66913 RepID=UPI002351020E|nr:adenylate cyclase type 10-like isoform X2 [Ictalurus furcatus]